MASGYAWSEINLSFAISLWFVSKALPGRCGGGKKPGTRTRARPNGVRELLVPLPPALMTPFLSLVCVCVCEGLSSNCFLAETDPVACRNFRFHLLCIYPVKRYKFTRFYFIFAKPNEANFGFTVEWTEPCRGYCQNKLLEALVMEHQT